MKQPFAQINTKSERVLYIDALKTTAIFAVVLIHSAAIKINNLSPDSLDFTYANFMDSVSRFCVPVFFMASGATILSRQYDTMDFYKKRAARILPALLFWSLFFLSYRYFIKAENFGPTYATKAILSGNVYYHLWFLYSILIVYALSPFIKKLFDSIRPPEGYAIFGIWFVSCILAPFAEHLLGQKFGFGYGELGLYSGYFALGYALSKSQRHVSSSTLALLFVMSVLFVFYFTGIESAKSGGFEGYFYGYNSMFVFFESVSLFLLFKNVSVNSPALKSASMLSPLVFGIYLIHPLFLEIADFMQDLTLKAVLVFAVSAFAVAVLSKGPLKKVL